VPQRVTLAAGKTVLLDVQGKSLTTAGKKKLPLAFKVANLLIGAGEPLPSRSRSRPHSPPSRLKRVRAQPTRKEIRAMTRGRSCAGAVSGFHAAEADNLIQPGVAIHVTKRVPCLGLSAEHVP